MEAIMYCEVLKGVGRILICYPRQQRWMKFINILPIHVKTQHKMAPMNYFDSNMSNSTHTIVHFEERWWLRLMDAGNLCNTGFRSILCIVKLSKALLIN